MRYLWAIPVGLFAAYVAALVVRERRRRQPIIREPQYYRRPECDGPYDQDKAVTAKRLAFERDIARRKAAAVRALPKARVVRIDRRKVAK